VTTPDGTADGTHPAVADRGVRVGRTTPALDVPELHARALDATRRVVVGVGPDQWDVRVETAGTDVRRLVNHVVGGNWEVEPVVGGEPLAEVRARYRGDVLGDDPVVAYDQSAASAAAAFRAPGAMTTPCDMDGSGCPRPGSDYCGNRFVDVLVHGWEIAKVTGQDTRLDPELAESARLVIEPEILALRANGTIQGPLEVPEDAGAQTRLLALFGFFD
jgi:uncharacterized protein (TIGR03086 family)